MKRNLSSKEILNLPKEKFIEYMQKLEEERFNNMHDLGIPGYENYSFDEKVIYWCEELNKRMRNQVESGLDEYAIFSPIWHRTMKRLEPDFDLIIIHVFKKFSFYSWEWKKVEYLKRIQTL